MAITTNIDSETAGGIQNKAFEKDETSGRMPGKTKEAYELNSIKRQGDGRSSGTEIKKRQDDDEDTDLYRCGLGILSPKWCQKFATKRVFIIVFSILGVIQSMTWAYFSATLTTLEKRFRLSSQTAGIVMTGNEISQIVFSIILSYYGTKGHRPRWIAAGVILSSIACFLLASPHVLYGSGTTALSYIASDTNGQANMQTFRNRIIIDPDNNNTTEISEEFTKRIKKYGQPCLGPEVLSLRKPKHCDTTNEDDFSLLPLVLIFLSQFASGIGNILFFSLGGPYLDDNTTRAQLPMVFGITHAFRLIGPTLGYVLASGCLKLFINPLLNPVIDNDDPRWIGAWWLGWIVLGCLMGSVAFFIALFPRELRDSKKHKKSVEDGKSTDTTDDEETVIKISELPNAIKVLITNKVNLLNTLAGVFYLFAAVGYWTYAPKYLETIFLQSSSNASITSGLVGIVFQAAGFVGSGFLVSKWKPSARILAGWNVAISLLHVSTMIIFTQIGCNPGKIEFGTNSISDGAWNLTSACNLNCGCENNKVLPVCFKEENKLFFSPCHAGCSKLFQNGSLTHCSCLNSPTDTVELGTCSEGCFTTFFIFLAVTAIVKTLDSTGRIGNTLVAYRCVSKHERSLSIGIGIFLVSIFALLPAPIVFGRLVDSVCLIWNRNECQSGNGNCLFYDGEKLRYVFNLTASVFVFIGGILDCFVWYYVKDLELYSENDNTEQSKLDLRQNGNTEKKVKT